MNGPPGSGKSMLAARMPSILPPLTPAELLEISMIQSVGGQLAEGTLTDRRKYLVVLERTDVITWLSLRNAPEVHIVAVDQLNTYDVLASDDVVFTKGAYDTFVGAKTEEAAK